MLTDSIALLGMQYPLLAALPKDPICNPFTIGQPFGEAGIPGPHTMAGVPVWLAMAGIMLIVFTSHLLLLCRGDRPHKPYGRFNLLRLPGLKALVNKPFFPLLAQSITIALFLLVIFAGLFGSARTNIAPTLTWTWWWILLIFFVLGFGQVFCAVCPWEGLSSLVSSLSLKSRKKRLGFEVKWPSQLRNIYPALGLFILLTWFELGRDITRSPQATAMLALLFVGMAVLTALVFERRAFCRHLCFVGRIQGLYALFSPTELRPVKADVCRSCVTKDCYRGNETSTGCPTHLFPGNLMENSYCTLCTECVRACPHDNLGINIRPPASDLSQKLRFRKDEALFAVVLLALTSFHGITMTPYWTRLIDILRAEWGWGAQPVFTLLMLIMILLPLLLFQVASWCSSKLANIPELSPQKIFNGFAYSLIPIALFYHVAHNGMHFFMEAQHILPLLSDPFGWGWNLFGTANKTYAPWLSLTNIWWLQISMIVIGHIYGVIVADRVAGKLFTGHSRKRRMRNLTPLIFMMIVYSGFSVWLVAQPMEMRSGM